MDKKMDLARLMLEKIKGIPSLVEHLEVSEDGVDLETIPLANLFYHMEEYYNKAATVKSALEFLTEDVGIRKSHCIIVVVVSDRSLYRTIASIIAEETEGFFVAKAQSLSEGQNLINYFSLGKWSCGLITEHPLSDGSCYGLLAKCKNLPSCVIVQPDSPTVLYVNLLAEGASSVVPRNDDFQRLMKLALIDMFLEGA